MLQVKPQDLPTCEAAMAAVLQDADTAEGIHDLRPMGPWPAEGSAPPRNGRVPGGWGCGRCGKVAADTSRAVELAKKPCGGSQWVAVAALHDLEAHADQWRCRRCMLVALP